MNMNPYSHKSPQFLALALLFVVTLACGTTSSGISPTVDKNQMQTAIAGTFTVANNQTMTSEALNNPQIPNSNLEPANTPEPVSSPLPPTEPSNTNSINPGTYIVGSDIRLGIYKGNAGEGIFDSCYWERLKDLTGNFDAIIANDNSAGQFYLEVKDSDYALKTDCQLVLLEVIPEHTGEYPTNIPPGTYLIDSDIRPGTYRGQAGSDISGSCYWERLKSVTGEFDSILANDNATGQFYIQIQPSDFALKTSCEIEWVGE